MAIFFHEGLPGAGKSFEALVKHIVPNLQKGRHVYAYIEGLNFEKIAAVCEMPVGAVKALLHVIEKDQVKEIHKHVTKDSFVLIDEIQDFFPSDRKPLDEEITRFVTQHRHDGIDILLMGQDHRDCHSLWKRRIQNLVTFMKMDAVGMEKRYKWTMHRYNGKKYVPITSGMEIYDPKYFGCYASHTEGTTNTGNYKDKRAVIWNKWGIKFGVPATLVISIWAVWNLYAFFHPNDAVAKVVDVPAEVEPVESLEARRARRAQERAAALKAAPVSAAEPAQEAKRSVEVVPAQVQYLLDLQRDHRLRLSGVVRTESGAINGFIEAVDSSFHIRERFWFSELEEMGWKVEWHSYGVLLSRDSYSLVARQWPIDPVGFTPNDRRNRAEYTDTSPPAALREKS